MRSREPLKNLQGSPLLFMICAMIPALPLLVHSLLWSNVQPVGNPTTKNRGRGHQVNIPKFQTVFFIQSHLVPKFRLSGLLLMGLRICFTLFAIQSVQDHLSKNDGTIPFYDDFYSGTNYLAAVSEEKIKNGDTILLFSLDGAQLYEHKQSDCWIYIWVILNLSPDK